MKGKVYKGSKKTDNTRKYETKWRKIKSDMSGKELVPATQSKLNVTPDPLEVQIDHIKPRSSGESNSYSNAQVLSREENIFKSNK